MSGAKQAQKTNDMIGRNDTQIQQEHQNDVATGGQRTQQAEGGVAEDRGATQGAVNTMAGRDYSTNYTPDFSQSNAAFKGFTDNGGVDQDKMRVAQPLYQDQMGNNQIADNFRANGTYSEFNKTGGVSDADKANLRSRGTSVIPAFYSRLNDENTRQATVQGGYNPGGMAMKARLARDQAAGAQDAARDTELGISDQVRQGREWGATGMTGAEGSLQDERFRAGNALDQSESNIQKTLQAGKMFGASGLAANEGATNQLNSTQATNNANRMFGRDNSAIDSNQQLLNTDVGRASDQYHLAQGDEGMVYDAQGNVINQRVANNPRRDYLGMALGAGAGVTTALTNRR